MYVERINSEETAFITMVIASWSSNVTSNSELSATSKKLRVIKHLKDLVAFRIHSNRQNKQLP